MAPMGPCITSYYELRTKKNVRTFSPVFSVLSPVFSVLVQIAQSAHLLIRPGQRQVRGRVELNIV